MSNSVAKSIHWQLKITRSEVKTVTFIGFSTMHAYQSAILHLGTLVRKDSPKYKLTLPKPVRDKLVFPRILRPFTSGSAGSGQASTSTSTSTLFHKTISSNRLARKIAIANLGGPVKRKINWKERKGKERKRKEKLQGLSFLKPWRGEIFRDLITFIFGKLKKSQGFLK